MSGGNTDFAAADERWMAHAIRLSRRALGNTAENPPVGCVIVRKGMPVGLGWTAPGGRPHAETEALAMAGEAARDATAYVTLEPCAHHGCTPPCAEALVQAGIRRVVVAVRDPDPRVAGRGLERLEAAGIEIATGLMDWQARRVLAGFLSRIERGRPHVHLKLAVSADGKIAAEPGRPTAITGPEALARAHLMRARSDAILVGSGTVKSDDPSLTCRLPGLEDRSPIRVVLDDDLTIPEDCRLVATANRVPTWIFTTLAARDRALAFQEEYPHVRIIPVAHDRAGHVSLEAVLEKLAEEGVNRLMVEGGSQVARSFVECGLVDEVAIFSAPEKVLGEGAVEALAGLPLEKVTGGEMEIVEETPLGPDVLRVYERRHNDGAG